MYIYIYLPCRAACGGLSSLTRDWTHILCVVSMESYPLNHQGNPKNNILMDVNRYCAFDLHFPDFYWCWAFYWPSVCCLWRNVYSSPSAFFSQVASCCGILGVLYEFPILNSYQVNGLQTFSPVTWVAFSLRQLCPLMHRSFYFHEVRSSIFSFYLCFCCHIQEIIAKFHIAKYFPCAFS